MDNYLTISCFDGQTSWGVLPLSPRSVSLLSLQAFPHLSVSFGTQLLCYLLCLVLNRLPLRSAPLSLSCLFSHALTQPARCPTPSHPVLPPHPPIGPSVAGRISHAFASFFLGLGKSNEKLRWATLWTPLNRRKGFLSLACAPKATDGAAWQSWFLYFLDRSRQPAKEARAVQKGQVGSHHRIKKCGQICPRLF